MPPSKSDNESGSSQHRASSERHSPCQPADPHQQHEAIKRAAADAAASRLPARYFPLGHTNPGFDIPEYLSDAEKAAAIEPPAKIRTFSDRLEQDLDDKERAKYHEFRETVVAAGWPACGVDEWTTLRFLVARQFDLKKAHEMLANHVEWLKQYHPEQRMCQACAQDPRSHMQHFVGWDLQHHPILYATYLYHGDRKNADNTVEHCAMTFRHAVSLMPEGIEQWVTINDFVSFSAWQDARSGVGSKVVQIMQDHYPERLAMQILIDPPTSFWVLWKMIKPFVDEKTKKKVHMWYTKKTPNIRDEFPKYFPPHVSQYLIESYCKNKRIYKDGAPDEDTDAASAPESEES